MIANFDVAANVQKNPDVLKTYIDVASISYNSNSTHSFGNLSQEYVDNATAKIKHIFPFFEYIEYVGGGGTMANKRAILDSIPFNPKTLDKDKKKDIVLISSMEHSSIHITISNQLLQRGYSIVLIPSTTFGFIDIGKFEELLNTYKECVALVSIHSVNNEIGTIQDISQLVKVFRKTNPGSIFHSDAAQGIYNIFEWTYYPDIVTLSLYKIGGVHSGIVLHNCTLQENYSGTLDVPMIVSCAHALELYMKNVNNQIKLCSDIKSSIQENIVKICNELTISVINLSDHNTVPYIQSFLFPTGYQGSVIVKMLDEMGILSSSGSACSSQKKSSGSHVLQSMGYSKDTSTGSIRLSFSHNTTEGECELLYDSIKKVLTNIKSIVLNSSKPTTSSINIIKKSSSTNSKQILRTTTPLDATIPDVHINAILIVYGELSLKKNNKQQFVRQLIFNVIDRLDKKKDKLIQCYTSSFIITTPDRIDTLITILSTVSGIIKISPGILNDNSSFSESIDQVNTINSHLVLSALKSCDNVKFRIKSNVRDAKKWNDFIATNWNYMYGQYIVDRFDNKVTVHLDKYDLSIYIELMEKYTFVYTEVYKGLQGLPVGTEGKLLCMISEDNLYRSIAASIKMIGRGARVDFLHELKSDDLNILNDIMSKYEKFTVFDKIPPLYKYQCIIKEPKDITLNATQYHQYLQDACNIFGKLCISITEATSEIDLNFVLNKVVNNPISFQMITDNEEILILLSGGIDSPVAAYKLLQLGYKVRFVHFATDFNKIDNIVKIIQIMKDVYPNLVGRLYVIEFKSLQDKIKDVCVESYRVLMYKIYMLRSASFLADSNNILVLATGNSWGQVASQTPENIVICRTLTNKIIVSPLVGYNKDDIIQCAKYIGTYVPSTCDGTDDCCVMYLPKHPVLKGDINKVREFMENINDEDDVYSLPMKTYPE